MPRTLLQGRFRHRVRSAAIFTLIAARVAARRALGRPLVREPL